MRLALVLAVLVGVNLYVFLWRGDTSIPDVMERASVADEADFGERLGGEIAETEPGADDEDETRGGQAPSVAPTRGEIIRGVVSEGESLDIILRGSGLSAGRAYELIEVLDSHMEVSSVQPGQPYRIQLDADGAFAAFEFEVSQALRVQAYVDEPGGEIEAEAIEADTEVEIEEVGGTIRDSLYLSIAATGEDTSLVSFFVDVFAYDLNFYVDTHPGDTFRMLIEKEYLDGEFYRYGDAVAAEYSGVAGTFRAFRWTEPDAEEAAYFDEEGRPLARSLLRTPLKYTRVSSGFNPRRMHPVHHEVRGHFGTDYAAPTGTPVWAAGSGEIVRRGWGGGGAGNMVVIDHDDGLRTRYMHLSGFADGKGVGHRVSEKEVIGYVGQTGTATGPHLHFEVIQDGQHVNPEEMELERGDPLSDELLAEFEDDTEDLVPRLAEVRVRHPWEEVGRAIDSYVAGP